MCVHTVHCSVTILHCSYCTSTWNMMLIFTYKNIPFEVDVSHQAYFILEDAKENAFFQVNMDKSNPELAYLKAFGEDAMVVIYFAQ